MSTPSINDESFRQVLEWNAKQKFREDCRIVCAANRNNITGQILLGARHWDTMMHLAMGDNSYESWSDCDSGFIDQFGNFYYRHEAFIVAERQNQIIHIIGTEHNRKLFSENLY